MANSLKIRSLGGLSIQRDGDPVDGFASRKAELLLVYLACNPRVHRREVLADLLWDDRSQKRAMANLRVVLSSLRKVAGEFVTIQRDTAAINPQGVWLDAAELERVLAGEVTQATVPDIAAALDLYRADFLAGVHVRGASGFEEWAARERERLHRLAVEGCQRLVGYYLEVGDYREGIGQVTRLLEIEPLLEAGHRQLMELLARSGQREAALKQYESCRRLLEEELGVEPAAETVALNNAIRDGALADSSGVRPSPATVVPEVVSLPAFLAEDAEGERDSRTFVARERELAWLDAHMEQTIAGNGRILFITGEAGMGKSTLLQEFARRTGEKHPTLLTAAGRCSALAGSGDPYLPFRQILAQLTGDVETALAAGDLTREQATRLWEGLAGVLAVVAEEGPGLVNRLLSGPTLLARGEAATTSRQWLEPLRGLARQDGGSLIEADDVQQQVTAVLRSLARQRPLLLLLDDAQWLDRASVALLFHLVLHLSGCRLLLVAAYRGEEVATAEVPPHPLLKVVNEAGRRFGEVELNLAPVIRREGRAFVDELLDAQPNGLDEDFRQRLVQRTGGHPLFTVELLRAMRARGDLVRDSEGCWVKSERLEWSQLPAQVEGVIAERVNRVPAELRRLLEVASVEGETFTAQVLGTVLDTDERQVLRQLSGELDRRYWLVRVEGQKILNGRRLARYRFRHALFREFLYRQLDEVERAYLHEDVGVALETLYAGKTGKIAGQLAYHFRVAEMPEKAIAYAQQAGDAARQLYAHDEAVEHYRHALAFLKAAGEYERAARTLMKLGLAHHQAFQYPEARQAYEEGFVLWRAQPMVVEQFLSPASHPLRVASEEMATLDPALASDLASANAIMLLFAGLVEEAEMRTIVPDLAGGWEIKDGGRTYIFDLRPDVHWSDGKPLTAQDFEFAWKRALAPATKAPLASLFYDIKGAQAYNQGELADVSQIGVRALSEKVLLVELEQPTAYFLHVAASWAARAVPAHALTAFGDAWTDPANVVSSGPYLLDRWQAGTLMELARNGRYHRSYPGNVERVELHFTQPGEEGWRESAQLYEADKLDVMQTLGAPGHASFAQFVRRHSDDYFLTALDYTLGFTFYLEQAPFADEKVRRAFALALDRRLFVREARPTYSLPADGGFVPPAIPGHTRDVGLPFAPREARRLLALAGFPRGEGFPVVTIYWVDLPSSPQQCRWLAEQWRRQLGVTVDWQLLPISDFRMMNRDLGKPGVISSVGWEPDYPDPDNFLRVAWRLHQPFWPTERYLRLVEEARRLTDQSRRLALYQEADRILVESAYLVPLAYEGTLLLIKPWVRGYRSAATEGALWKNVIIEPH